MPFSFEMPKWWEMREGVTIPAIPVGKPMEGGKGYVPERNPYFKKFTTRTMRPVINFDTCVKCTLCWIQCPDSCFDVTPDGLYDANMEACCGCGVCEAVCPVKDCITMVKRGRLRRQREPVGDVAQGQGRVQDLDDREDPRQGARVRSHGFRFRGQYEEELKQELEPGGIEITRASPARTRRRKKR